MKNKPQAHQAAFWEERYEQKTTAWNIGRPHALLPKLRDTLLKHQPTLKEGAVVVPGAGHSHCAAYWAQQNHRTTAVDFAQQAIEEAQALYAQQESLTIVHDDIFASKLAPESFDICYDRAMLCALPPTHRAQYLQAIHKLLKPNGIYCGIFFTAIDKTDRTTPPWPISVHEQLALSHESYELLFAEEHKYDRVHDQQVIMGESVSIWLKA